MEPIKILIVEDELLTAERMRLVLEKNGYRIALANSEEQALRAVDKDEPDLILMDIRLNGETEGIHAAQKIREKLLLPIIFITQLQDEEIFRQAKETFPQNYITKPFSDSVLIHAIELSIQYFGNEKGDLKHIAEPIVDGIFVPTTGNIKVKLLFKDILYIEANGAYSKIHFDQNEKNKSSSYEISLSSNHLVRQLARPEIIKVHRSYHVNILKIDKVSRDTIFIKDVEISVGAEHYYKALKKSLRFVSFNP